MQIKLLMENKPFSDKFKAEHGLSVYIKTKKHTILFDAGESDGYIENAKALGIDLKSVDTFILSHGHSDHGGGLKKFLDINIRARVYVSEHAFGKFFNGAGSYIGLDPELANSGRIIRCGVESLIDNELWLFSGNDQPRPYEFGTFGLTEEINGEKCPDRFLHEQYLIVTEEGRSVLFTGCAHKGITNIMTWVEKEKPLAVIGGFHFMKIPVDTDEGKAFLDESAKQLCAYNTYYFTCHCTGEEQFNYLKSKMGARLKYLASGQELRI